MRPLVLLGTRISSRPYAISLIVAGLISGCCQGGSNSDPNAQANANPASSSAPAAPTTSSSSSEASGSDAAAMAA